MQIASAETKAATDRVAAQAVAAARDPQRLPGVQVRGSLLGWLAKPLLPGVRAPEPVRAHSRLAHYCVVLPGDGGASAHARGEEGGLTGHEREGVKRNGAERWPPSRSNASRAARSPQRHSQWVNEQLETVGAAVEAMVRRAKQQANRSLASAMQNASKLHEPAQFRVAAPLSLDRMVVSDAVDVDSDAEEEPSCAAASGAGAVSKIEFLEQQLEELRALMEAQAFAGGAGAASAPAAAGAASDATEAASPEAAGRAAASPGDYHDSPGAASHASRATRDRASVDAPAPSGPSQGVLERAGIFVPAGRPSMVDLVAKATATVQLRSVSSSGDAADGSESGPGNSAPRTPVRRFGGGGSVHDASAAGVGAGGAGGAGGGASDNNMTALLRSAMQQRFGRAGAARNTRGCMSGELSPMSDVTGVSDDSGSDAGTVGNNAAAASSPLPAAPMLRGLAGSRRTSFGRRSSSGGKHDDGRRSSSSRRRSGIRKSLAGVGHSIPDVIHEVRPASSGTAGGSRLQHGSASDAEETKSPTPEVESDRPSLPVASGAASGSGAAGWSGRGRRGMHPAAAAIAAAAAGGAGGALASPAASSPRDSSRAAGADSDAASNVPLGGTRPRQPFLGAIADFNKGSLRHHDGGSASEGESAARQPPAAAARRGPPAGLLGAIRQQKGRPEAKAAPKRVAPAEDRSAAANRPVPSRAAPSFAAALQQAAAEAQKRRAGAQAAPSPRNALGSTTAGNKSGSEDAPRKAAPMSLLESIKGFKAGGLRKTGGPARAGAEASAEADGSATARAAPRPGPRAAPPMGLGAMIQGVKLRKTGRKL